LNNAPPSKVSCSKDWAALLINDCSKGEINMSEEERHQIEFTLFTWMDFLKIQSAWTELCLDRPEITDLYVRVDSLGERLLETFGP